MDERVIDKVASLFVAEGGDVEEFCCCYRRIADRIAELEKSRSLSEEALEERS